MPEQEVIVALISSAPNFVVGVYVIHRTLTMLEAVLNTLTELLVDMRDGTT